MYWDNIKALYGGLSFYSIMELSSVSFAIAFFILIFVSALYKERKNNRREQALTILTDDIKTRSHEELYVYVAIRFIEEAKSFPDYEIERMIKERIGKEFYIDLEN